MWHWLFQQLRLASLSMYCFQLIIPSDLWEKYSVHEKWLGTQGQSRLIGFLEATYLIARSQHTFIDESMAKLASHVDDKIHLEQVLSPNLTNVLFIAQNQMSTFQWMPSSVANADLWVKINIVCMSQV